MWEGTSQCGKTREVAQLGRYVACGLEQTCPGTQKAFLFHLMSLDKPFPFCLGFSDGLVSFLFCLFSAFKNYVFYFKCVCVSHECGYPERTEEGLGPQPLKLGPLQEQQVLTPTKLSLQLSLPPLHFGNKTSQPLPRLASNPKRSSSLCSPNWDYTHALSCPAPF